MTHGQQLDRYGGFLDVKGEHTGFFHTEHIHDRWWLVTPDGHGFFGIGLSHPITSMSEAAITFAYGGSQEEWMRDGIRKMRALGFNCVWSGPYSLERIPSGNIDTDLADGIYRNARIPYAIHVPIHAVARPAFLPTGGGCRRCPREHLLMAASLTVSIPGITLFVVAQKYFVRGIVLSGIKG